MDAAAELGRNTVSKHQIQRVSIDGTAEHVSRNQILKCEGGQGNFSLFS